MTEKYVLTFKNTQIRIDEDTLTFSIGHIKSRVPSAVSFKFIAYDLHKNILETYESSKWIITPNYTHQEETFTFTFDNPNFTHPRDIDTFTIEMNLFNITSENPLYMNHLQLNTGGFTEYHTPNEELKDVKIGFNRNHYVNLYGKGEEYLQIIRPNHDDFSTTALTPANITVLAPHLPYENEFDDPVSIFYEYMYQTEQVIGVEK